MFRPFSKRHQKSLYEDKTIKVSIPRRLRRRLWLLLDKHNYSFTIQPNKYDSYASETDVLTESTEQLRRVHGWKELQVRQESGEW